MVVLHYFVYLIKRGGRNWRLDERSPINHLIHSGINVLNISPFPRFSFSSLSAQAYLKIFSKDDGSVDISTAEMFCHRSVFLVDSGGIGWHLRDHHRLRKLGQSPDWLPLSVFPRRYRWSGTHPLSKPGPARAYTNLWMRCHRVSALGSEAGVVLQEWSIFPPEAMTTGCVFESRNRKESNVILRCGQKLTAGQPQFLQWDDQTSFGEAIVVLWMMRRSMKRVYSIILQGVILELRHTPSIDTICKNIITNSW
jgi:hypothetical protein